jgi:hypothetical protein
VAMGLDAIGIDVEHQGADFAAGSGADRHGRKGLGRHSVARPCSGGKDCVAPIGAPAGIAPIGAPLGNAPIGAPRGNAARPDPCRRCGVGHGAVVPRPLLWRQLCGSIEGSVAAATDRRVGSSQRAECWFASQRVNAAGQCSRPIAIDGQAHGSAAGIPNAWHWF